MTKKIISVILSAVVILGIFAAGTQNADNINHGTSGNSDNTATVKEIRYLNFKPEVADV